MPKSLRLNLMPSRATAIWAMRASIMMVEASGLPNPKTSASTMATAIQTLMSSSTFSNAMNNAIRHFV